MHGVCEVQGLSVPPVQTPLWHVVLTVHSTPSSHDVPSFAASLPHVPLMHAPVLHASEKATQSSALLQPPEPELDELDELDVVVPSPPAPPDPPLAPEPLLEVVGLVTPVAQPEESDMAKGTEARAK